MSLRVEPSLLPFFAPRGVAIVGASSVPTKLGFGVARNLVQSGYAGAIHFVNPRGGRLLERPVYTCLAEVPDPVDLTVLIVPAVAVPGALDEAGRRGIRAAIISSGGFRETGPPGAALEDACLSIARDHDMRIIGPNCVGLLDTHFPLDTTFLPPPGPTPGDIAFISHSGAICAAVIDWARGQGFGLSRLISLGNQADVRETDMLTSVAADPHTRVITLYLEGISDGRRFVHAAGQVTQEKPIIALKVGRYAAGRRAVTSHTGALAGQEEAFNAAFRRAGVIRANTSEELFDWARALAWCPLPAGPRVAVLTNAGGPGVTAADALEAAELTLAELDPATEEALRSLLPRDCSVRNPVDMLAAATGGQYAESLRLLLADPGVDSVMVVLPPPPMESAGGVARAIIPIIYSATKPVVVALMGERMIQEAVEYFRAARVPDYRFPERAAGALAVLTERAAFLRGRSKSHSGSSELHSSLHEMVAPDRVLRILNRLTADGSQSPKAGVALPAEALAGILHAYGIPTAPLELATSAEEAAAAAQRLGYPVALKIASDDVVHKSDVAGIRLNLTDAESVTQAYDDMMVSVRAALPAAVVKGAHVQRMIDSGQEVIIGTLQDPQFGPLVMFGSGGVEVEGLKDVAFALAPVSEAEASHMLERTWAGRRLAGFRNLPPADRHAVVGVIQRLAQLAADFPQLAELEINPLRVLSDTQGAYAVDVRGRLAAAEPPTAA